MSMDIFMIIGDILHVVAILILLWKLISTKSCAGISGRTQILFALTYTTRYLDLMVGFISYYNCYMKILYIATSYIIVLLIFCAFRRTYEHEDDGFLTEFLIIPCFIQAIWLNHDFTPLEICWTFSIYLEAVAILPQFYMIYKKRQMNKSMFFFLLAMGLYRGFYIFHWIYRYVTTCQFDMIVDGAGLIYAFVYIMGAAEMLFNGIKIVKDEKRFLKRNIFLISNNELLTAQLDSNYQHLENEKSDEYNRPVVEKV